MVQQITQTRDERMRELAQAHARMLGRADAANIEHRRAVRTGRWEDVPRWSRASSRRLRASIRIGQAMARLVRERVS